MGLSAKMKRHRKKGYVTDFALGMLSPEESLRVLEEIEHDPGASADLELATALLNVAQTDGEELFAPGDEALQAKVQRRKAFGSGIRDFVRARPLAFPVGVASALGLLLVVLLTVSKENTSKYYALARIDPVEFVSRVRGFGEDEIQSASSLFSDGRWDESIKVLEWYTRAFPQSDRIDYVHYFAGSVYLLSAPRSYLTLFPSFDRDRVLRAIAHLERAARSPSSQRIREESHWLLAKAYLMLEMPTKASEELERVLSVNGQKKAEAAALIAAIQAIH
jgi:ElaB/YqjD/DUF883 family membrane-anchored ribosome-binding protein